MSQDISETISTTRVVDETIGGRVYRARIMANAHKVGTQVTKSSQIRVRPTAVNPTYQDDYDDFVATLDNVATDLKDELYHGEDGLQLWLDASDTSTLFQNSTKTTPVTTAGQSVGAWADKSGRSRDTLQATSGKRPTYQTSPARIVFDGDDDFLLAQPLNHGIGTSDFYTVVVPAWTNTTLEYNCVFSIGRSGLICYFNTETLEVYFNGTSQVFEVDLSDNAQYLIELFREGNTLSLVFNGELIETTLDASISALPDGIFMLGVDSPDGFSPLSGNISELRLYAGLPSEDERTAIRNALNTKWSIY